MCGISGHYHFSRDQKIDPVALENSIKELSLRGPDGQYLRTFPGMGMAHSRLSIIDLNSGANQPMSDYTGRYWMVFNGEILNYLDLKKDLNYPFQTASDSEVLLASYIQWGEACLQKFRGFFSFVIYDKETHSLFAARDQMGIKPFIYCSEGESFYFSSELKSLTCFPINKKISQDAINSFFQLSYIPDQQGIFENVKRLLPGHFLKIQGQSLKIERYFSLPDIPDNSISLDDAKEHLSLLVNQTADQWVLSDAPLGAFLSGGVDSSIVVALASQRIKNLKTFSVTFPESPFHNEGPYAQAVAQKYSTEHTEIPLTTQNIYDCVDKVLGYLDEPFADSSAVPTFALSEIVGKRIRVSLSGDGADEIFGGYEKHKAESLASRWQAFSPIAARLLALTKDLPQSRDTFLKNNIRKLNRFLDGVSLDEDERYLRWCSAVSPAITQSILLPSKFSSQWKKNLTYMSEKRFKGINRVLYRDSQMVLPNDMLTKVDMMSMGNSLEVRPLFLDPRIVEFAFSLPGTFKVQDSRKKILLLETFKHLLPESVYNRPKHGFTVELMPFFRGPFWEKLNDVYLNESLVREQGIFNPAAISQLKKDIQQSASKDIQPLIWELVTFQNFFLKYKADIS